MQIIDLSFLGLLSRAIAILIVLTTLGLAMAVAARLLGNSGPALDGKLTLNPFRHIDLWAFVSGLCLLGGWIRPLNLEPTRDRPWRPAVVAVLGLAGCVGVAALAKVLGQPIAALVPPNAASFVAATAQTAGLAGLAVALVNLVPIPPLAGGYVLQSVAPQFAARLWAQSFWTAPLLAVLAATIRARFTPHALVGLLP